MNIKIKSCSDENYWYKEKIGYIYELFRMDNDDYVVINSPDKTTLGSVMPEDMEETTEPLTPFITVVQPDADKVAMAEAIIDLNNRLDSLGV